MNIKIKALLIISLVANSIYADKKPFILIIYNHNTRTIIAHNSKEDFNKDLETLINSGKYDKYTVAMLRKLITQEEKKIEVHYNIPSSFFNRYKYPIGALITAATAYTYYKKQELTEWYNNFTHACFNFYNNLLNKFLN